MASWRAPESAANSKERRVNNALSARRRPPRLVWSEERERKENEPWVLRFSTSVLMRSASSSSPRRGQRPRGPRRSSLAVVEPESPSSERNLPLECRGARVEEQGEDVELESGSTSAERPENSRLMREAEEKERKTKVSEVAKRVERKKKAMAHWSAPLVRGKQQRGKGKQRALGKEKSAATRLE